MEKIFIDEARKMWDIKHNGQKVSLSVDFESLRLSGISNSKIKVLKKVLPCRNINYYYLVENKTLKLFIEESDNIHDWLMNFMAMSVKIKIGDYYRRYHAGFYIAAITVFNDLDLTLYPDIQIYGYSHGAGVAPILGSFIRNNSESSITGDQVIGFEQPSFIFRPSKEVKRECRKDVWFKQGNDIVCDIPWWMTHTGVKVKIKGQKLPFYKRILKPLFDHDIYWTDNRIKKMNWKQTLTKIGKYLLIILASGFAGDRALSKDQEPVTVVEAGQEAISELLTPTITKVVREELKAVVEDIGELKAQKVEEVTGRAVAAYSKVFTVEDLKNSPEKRYSIKSGLLLPSCKDILMAIDRDRTVLFNNYLTGGSS